MSKMLNCSRCGTEVEVGERTTEVLCTECTQLTYEEWLEKQNKEKDYFIGDRKTNHNQNSKRVETREDKLGKRHPSDAHSDTNQHYGLEAGENSHTPAKSVRKRHASSKFKKKK